MHACSPSSFKSFLPVTGLFILSLTASGEAPAVSFTPLGGLPGGILFSLAEGVSADGSTVVGLARSASGPEAFVWDATNGMRGLGDLPGGRFLSLARGVSADGSTVVGRGESASGPEAFVWDATNGIRGLGDLPGGSLRSEARGVSADGSTVVGLGRSASGPEAFVWDATNGMQGLGDLPGGRFVSTALGVSADGSTVVGVSNSDLGSHFGSFPEAFVWDATNGMQGLGDLPGSGFGGSEAFGVSADGSTVVGRGRLDSIEGPEAFVWDATNGMRGLGDLPGGGFDSAARGVSADGSIVVGGGESASGNEAFVWDATNGMQSLQVLLTSLGIDLSGWQLSEARGVSADGKTIVGSGRNPSGQAEGFIAVIPEPSTALLMGLGLVGLGMMRSRVAAWHRDAPQTI